MDLEHDRWLQERYARWLERCTRGAFWALVAAFAFYALGFGSPVLPLDELPRYWSLPLAEFIAKTGAPTGWEWVAHAWRPDYLTYAGICLFALVVLVCNVAMVVPLLRRGERLLAALSLAQAAVLLVAATGWVAGG